MSILIYLLPKQEHSHKGIQDCMYLALVECLRDVSKVSKKYMYD